MSSVTKPLLKMTRTYDPARDLGWLHALWLKTMGPQWSLSSQELQRTLAQSALRLVAEQEGSPVGFCAVGFKGSGPAGLLIILVEPASQRQGFGSALLAEAEDTLRQLGVTEFNLGFGNDGNYFWPGVPANHAWPFFTSCGWQETESAFDLVRSLADYSTPPWVYERLSSAGLVLRLATPELRTRLLAFEQESFPAWAPFLESAMDEGEYGNILLAQTPDGDIAGAVLLKAAVPAIWDADRNIRYGSINILGVAPHQQGKGAGIALTARALEILKERACSRCYIQWTGLVEWYGKLGATVWAEYCMSSKRLL